MACALRGGPIPLLVLLLFRSHRSIVDKTMRCERERSQHRSPTDWVSWHSIQCIKRYGWKCCVFPRAHAIHHDNFSPRIVYLNFKRGQGNFSLANGTVATCVFVNKELPPALTEESLRGYEELAVPFDDCGTNRTDGNTAWDTARLYFRRKNLKGVISV